MWKSLELQNYKKGMFERAWGELEEKFFWETMIYEIFETNSYKGGPYGKVQYPFLKSFWLVLKTFSFWQEHWQLVDGSSKFWGFPGNS